MIELALGLYFTATVFYALANGIYGTLPFLVLFQIGFLYTGLLSIVQQYAGDGVVLEPATEEELLSQLQFPHELRADRARRHRRLARLDRPRLSH